jgi:hypothetical protein
LCAGHLYQPHAGRPDRAMPKQAENAPNSKSFLLLFFKKEGTFSF